MRSQCERRALAAVACILGFGATAFLVTLLSGGEVPRGLQVAIFLGGFALGPGIFVAFGAEAMLNCLGMRCWDAYALVGSCCGGCLSVLFLGFLGTDPNGFIAGLACGVGGAVAYWSVLRPDRQRD